MLHITRPYFFFFALIINLHLIALAQQPVYRNLSKSQKRLLKQVTKYGKVESKNIGSSAIYSEQYARFDSLANISSISDLIFSLHTLRRR